MAATTDLSGVLAECVVQPTSNSPQYSREKQTCEIKLKGPYNILKDANTLVMNDLTTALSALSINVSKVFNYPAPPTGMKWWVTDTSVEQLEAGQHGILTIVCDTVSSTYDPGENGAFDPYSDTWSLRWESYTVKAVGFCANTPHEDRALTSMTGAEIIPGDADRQHINYFLEAGKDKSGYSGQIEHYWYRTTDGDFILNDAEGLVLEKALADKSALYHYPVLQHTTVKNYKPNVLNTYSNTLGEDIDHEVELPSDCPYTFPTTQGQSWTWIKTGDDMQQVKTREKTSYQRTETYMGVREADQNFYGNIPFNHNDLKNCRWKIGAV